MQTVFAYKYSRTLIEKANTLNTLHGWAHDWWTGDADMDERAVIVDVRAVIMM